MQKHAEFNNCVLKVRYGTVMNNREKLFYTCIYNVHVETLNTYKTWYQTKYTLHKSIIRVLLFHTDISLYVHAIYIWNMVLLQIHRNINSSVIVSFILWHRSFETVRTGLNVHRVVYVCLPSPVSNQFTTEAYNVVQCRKHGGKWVSVITWHTENGLLQ